MLLTVERREAGKSLNKMGEIISPIRRWPGS